VGAKFVYTTFPMFAMTKERVENLIALAHEYITDDVDMNLFDELGCEYNDKDEVIEIFVESINEMFDENDDNIFLERPDVSTIWLNDSHHYITGGMTWTIATCHAFDILSNLNTITAYIPQINLKINDYIAEDSACK